MIVPLVFGTVEIEERKVSRNTFRAHVARWTLVEVRLADVRGRIQRHINRKNKAGLIERTR